MMDEENIPPERRPRAPNIRDVARSAGVSHQTVSRVINGHPSLRDSTRQRVLNAMADLQFRPNRAARTLVTSRSRIIGVLMSMGSEFGPSASLKAIEEAAHHAGYAIDIANVESADRESIVSALDRLVDRAVEGLVILAPQSRSLQVIEELSIKLPFVTVHSTGRMQDHRMSVDQEMGARLAVKHLLELGHRHVAHVTGPDGWVETDARLLGFRREMAAWSMESGPVFQGDWTAESGYRAGLEMMNGTVFSAVFSANDQMALGLLHAFSDADLRVPRDVSVVGFDDIPEAAHYLPPLSTVRQNFPELGRRCIAALLRELSGDMPAPFAGDVAPELVVRRSSGPAAH